MIHSLVAFALAIVVSGEEQPEIEPLARPPSSWSVPCEYRVHYAQIFVHLADNSVPLRHVLLSSVEVPDDQMEEINEILRRAYLPRDSGAIQQVIACATGVES